MLAPPSPPPKDDDHECGWKAYAEAQERFLKEMSEQLESVQAQLAELKRARYGKKSEKRKSPKMPPPVRPESDPQAITSGIAGQKGVAFPPSRTGEKLEKAGTSNPLMAKIAATKPTTRPA